MSAFLYGRMVSHRKPRVMADAAGAPALAPAEQAAVAESEEDNKLLAALAALVPADVLAAHAFILTLTTKTVNENTTEITEPFWLKMLFLGLVIVTPVLYLLGRTTKKPHDNIRMFIPLLAFLTWAAILGTSGLTPWIGDRIPHVALAGGAILVGLVVIALNARLNALEDET